jgi:hypothetical protein
VETAHAGLNDRTTKLLETQSTNRPPINNTANTGNTTGDINARPSYGPTHGVFEPPSSTRPATGTPPPKR